MTVRPFDLGERLLNFAVTIGQIIKALPGDRLGSHVANQLVRSGTSPAAQHAEAQSAESRRDFVHKLKIGLKELRETLFWLRLVGRMKMNSGMKLDSAAAECEELIAIFVKSVETAQQHMRQ